MLEVAAAAALVASGAAATFAYLRRARAHARWRRLLQEAAERLGGRASWGTSFDAPQLRAEVDGVAVTVKLEDIHVPRRGRAVAASALPEGAEGLRLFVGWDVLDAPPGIEHFPEVSLSRAHALDGVVIARSNDAATADRFLELVAIDLLDIRREAFARSVSVMVRGGHLSLILAGFEETASLVERLVIVAARAARHVERARGGEA